MRFAYYDRLSAARKRIYRQSDAIEAVGLPRDVAAGPMIARLRAELAGENRAAVQDACQRLIDALVDGYKVPPIRIRVLAQRPSGDYGELHGLYEPEEGKAKAWGLSVCSRAR